MSSVIFNKIANKCYRTIFLNSKSHFGKLSTSYNNVLQKRPFLVQAIQAGILMGAGDFAAQTYLEKTKLKNIDIPRTVKFFAIGFCVVGPGVRVWYGLLDKAVKVKNPITKTLLKVGIDQLLFAPFFLAVLLSTISFLQQQNLSLIESKLKNEYLDILLANYYIWPAVQLVNFRFVPLNYQVLVTSSVAFLWNIYISWKTNLNESTQLLKIKD